MKLSQNVRLGVSGVGFRVLGSGLYRVWGLGCRSWGLGFRVPRRFETFSNWVGNEGLCVKDSGLSYEGGILAT